MHRILAFFSSSFQTELQHNRWERRDLLERKETVLFSDRWSSRKGFAIESFYIYRKAKIACYLHISISSWRKCLSQVYTLSLPIWLSKFLSICLAFVSSFNQSSRHFLYSVFLGAGSFQMPIPFVLLEEPQPKTAQLSPGIGIKILSLRREIRRLQRHETPTLTHYIFQRDSTIDAILKLAVHGHTHVTSKNINNNLLLWCLPVFLTSPLYQLWFQVLIWSSEVCT